MELALSVEVLPGFLEVHLGNRLLGSGPQAVGNLVDGDGFLGKTRGQVRVATTSVETADPEAKKQGKETTDRAGRSERGSRFAQ